MNIRSPLLSLGLALVLGLGAAVFATRWIQTRVSAAEADARAGESVVVVAAEIPFGARIEAKDLKLVAWPKGTAPEGAYASIGEVAGKFSNQKLLPGEVVLRQRAVAQGGGNSLSTLIEPNMRAVSVRVNDVIGVGGFLLPGNRVDVLATRMIENTDERRAKTRTLLQNIKVLAVDQTAQAEKDQPVVVRAVTLQMEPAQAELLVQATEEGTVQLALRNPDDESVVATPVATAAPVAAPQQAAARKPVAVSPNVTVIRQTQVVTSEVKS